MKVTVTYDLTPKEARELAGLPDVNPLWDEIGTEVIKADMLEKSKDMMSGDAGWPFGGFNFNTSAPWWTGKTGTDSTDD